jgi:hypothetical protein
LAAAVALLARAITLSHLRIASQVRQIEAAGSTRPTGPRSLTLD